VNIGHTVGSAGFPRGLTVRLFGFPFVKLELSMLLN